MIQGLKKLFLLISILFISQIIFSLETQITFHFDTYAGEQKYAASVDISERLTNTLNLNASLDYQHASNYLAYCTCGLVFPKFEANAGVIYDIESFHFSPGLTFSAKYNLSKKIAFKGIAYTTYSIDNVFDIYSVDALGSIIFSTKNTVFELNYEYFKKSLNSTENWEHHGGLKIQGFDEESPIQIDVNADCGFAFKNTDKDYMNIILNAGAIIKVKTKKAGTYFVSGLAEVYNQLNTTNTMPFSIAAGIKINL